MDLGSVVPTSFIRHENQLHHSRQKAFCSPVQGLSCSFLHHRALCSFFPKTQCLAKDAKGPSEASHLTSHRSPPSTLAPLSMEVGFQHGDTK